MSTLTQLYAEIDQVPPIGEPAREELALMGPQLLAHLDVMLTHHPELADHPLPVGPIERRRLHRALLRDLLATLARHDHHHFVTCCARRLSALRAPGFTAHHWHAQIGCLLNLIDENLTTDSAHALRPLFQWLLGHVGDLLGLDTSKAA